MSDEIVGISVLQKVWVPKMFRLWFVGRKDDGSRSQGWIFARDVADPGAPDKFPDYPEGVNSVWNFQRSGDLLVCHPSVNWISWGFHNGYNWQTRYVEMAATEKPYDASMEPRRSERGSAVHYDINWLGLSEHDQAELIRGLKTDGTLVQ